MISRSTLPQPPSPATGHLLTDAISSPSTPSSEPPSSPNPQTGRSKPSPQLSRWSRARSIRSGRKLNRRPIQLPNRQINDPDSPISGAFDSSDGNGCDMQALSPASQGEIDGDCLTDVTVPGKSIYMLSDGTGWTVEHAVNAALGQFEHCQVDRVSPVNTHLFSGIDGVDRLMEIVARAAKEAAMVVYTLADSSMAEAALQACRLWGVASLDVLSPITESIASHLGVSPSGLPRWAPGRRPVLGEEYFRRIEAVEFTIKQDDGALPENLGQADLVLTGVSRTGKTPLSIYLAQKGYKVANVPLVVGVGLPEGLFEVDPEKVFALTIDPLVLHTIRRTRARSLGFDGGLRWNYCDMDCVREESEFASRIFEQNPIWPVIEVTGRAVEETAAIILRLYHDRKNRCSMPRILRRY